MGYLKLTKFVVTAHSCTYKLNSSLNSVLTVMNKEFDKEHGKEFGDVLQVFVEFGDGSDDLISECGDSSVNKRMAV